MHEQGDEADGEQGVLTQSPASTDQPKNQESGERQVQKDDETGKCVLYHDLAIVAQVHNRQKRQACQLAD